jgi:hypothetical protein
LDSKALLAEQRKVRTTSQASKSPARSDFRLRIRRKLLEERFDGKIRTPAKFRRLCERTIRRRQKMVKSVRVIAVSSVFLLFGLAAAPTHSQQENSDKKEEKAPQHEQQPKPERQAKAPQQPEKQQQTKNPDQQQQAKPERQPQAKAPQQQQEAKPENQKQAKAPQQEQQAKPERQQQAKSPQQQQQAKPERQQQAKTPQEQQAKPERQQQSRGQQGQQQQDQVNPARRQESQSQGQQPPQHQQAASSQRPQRTQQAEAAQRAQPELRLSARSNDRIPEERFHSNFGREHQFSIGSPVMVGGYSRFQYGGYWFGFVEPWPVGWYYSDDFYIDYEDGGYYMYDPYYPGTRFAISVVL